MTAAIKRSYLLVDGHSVIHAWDELRGLHGRLPFRAREELIQRLTAFSDLCDDHVVVVFDGTGERVSMEAEEAGIQVFYADKSHTADDLIERLVAKYAQKYEMTVATNDSAEQMTVSSSGGFWISAEGLRERMDMAEKQLRRTRKF